MTNDTFPPHFLLVHCSCLISSLLSAEKRTSLPRGGAGAGGQEGDHQCGHGDRPVCTWTGPPVQLCGG